MSSVAPPKVAKEDARGSLPNVHKRYPKGNGDIVLISSDNVRFYVKSMHLAAARSVADYWFSRLAQPVWRDLLEIPPVQARVQPGETCLHAQEIVLADRDVEGSGSLEILMDAIHGDPLPAPLPINLRMLQDAVGLARKYDCRAALQLFHHAIRGNLINTTWPPQVFVLAALFDDIEACEYILKHSGHLFFKTDNEYTEHDQTRLAHFAPKALVFQAAGWPMDLAKAVPFKYLFALLRAEFETREERRNPRERWEKVATQFGELVRE
ncbi:hypothetical protein JCM24511_05779 [Saitozyma sp. JCM 24511]|nr:hypothetical protein JCM24511_05779 [Saitozyma sp. JCM 24511]